MFGATIFVSSCLFFRTKSNLHLISFYISCENRGSLFAHSNIWTINHYAMLYNYLHLSVSCKADLTMLSLSFPFLVVFVYDFARCLGTQINADPTSVDIRIHSSTPDLQSSYHSCCPEWCLLATASHWRHWLHRFRHALYVGNTTEVVFTRSYGSGLAYWRMELDRSK
jgi:hypothetical protein